MSQKIKCKKCGARFEKGVKRCPNCYADAPLSAETVIYICIAVALAIALIVGVICIFLDDGSVIDEPSSSDAPTSSIVSKEESSSSIISTTISTTKESSSNIAIIPTVTPNTENNIKYKQPTDNDNNISVATDGTVSITVPKWLLLKVEPDFNYQLTDKEINTYKFKTITKNSDGSATYTVDYNDYHKFLLITKSAVNAVVYEYSNNVWFSKIEADDGYNNINIYTKYDSLDAFDDGFGIYIALSGLQTTFYQYMHYNYDVGTTIKVYNKNNTLLATYKFPKLLK